MKLSQVRKTPLDKLYQKKDFSWNKCGTHTVGTSDHLIDMIIPGYMWHLMYELCMILINFDHLEYCCTGCTGSNFQWMLPSVFEVYALNDGKNVKTLHIRKHCKANFSSTKYL